MPKILRQERKKVYMKTSAELEKIRKAGIVQWLYGLMVMKRETF